MNVLFFEIESIISLIDDLESRRELVMGNDAKSRLLINRCSEFHGILEKLKHTKLDPTLEHSLQKLQCVISEVLDLVDNFCQPGWLRFVINVTNANRLNNQFEELNEKLSECRSDLHFGLEVIKNVKQEDTKAKEEDNRKLLNKIYEMLAINNIAPDIRSIMLQRSPSMLNLETAVQRLQEKIPEYDNIVHETELFMETIYAQGTDNEDEDEEDDVDPNEFYDACAAPVDISPKLSLKMIANPMRGRGLNDSVLEKSPRPGLSQKFQSKKSVLQQAIRFAQILRDQLRDADDHSLPWTPKPGHILGKGSFGVVYKGMYCKEGVPEPVAIKAILGFGLGVPPDELKKVEREIFILAKCKHPNIIDFRGCDMKEGLLLTGLAVTNLFAMLYKMHRDETGRTMSPSRDMKYQWLHDISAGIQYLHFYDIIHRDLKPHNILLSMSSDIEGSGRLVAKITDFGVSSVAGLSSTLGTTKATNAVGTTSYKAPELFNLSIPLRLRYSKAVDIYAFGVMANEMVKGSVPWSGCNPSELPDEVRRGGRPELFKAKTSAERYLLKVIGDTSSGCFAAEKDKRPDAAVLCEQMSHFIEMHQQAALASTSDSMDSMRSTTSSANDAGYDISAMMNSNLSIRSIESTSFRKTDNQTSNSAKSEPTSYQLSRGSTTGAYAPSDVPRLAAWTTSESSTSLRRASTEGEPSPAPLRTRQTPRSTQAKTMSPSPMTTPRKTPVTPEDIKAMLSAAKNANIVSVLQILDTTTIDINVKDKDGWTAFMWFASYSDESACRTLYERGADLNATDTEGRTALHITEDPAIAQLLIDLHANIDQLDTRGNTPLLTACLAGKVDIVDLLAQHTADLEAHVAGKTPLILASRFSLECVTLLLEYGANVHAVDKNGKNALDHAIEANQTEIIELLREYGAIECYDPTKEKARRSSIF